MLPYHEADIDTLRELKPRSFAAGCGEGHGVEFNDTPIGAALLEFNSAIGVPADVWIMLTTAYVQCATCHLVRSFPAHRGHLDDNGQCHDMGEGSASLDKGKGKASVSVMTPVTRSDDNAD